MTQMYPVSERSEGPWFAPGLCLHNVVSLGKKLYSMLSLSTQGRFPFGHNFQSNQLKCKWNAHYKWKFSGTNRRPSEVLHFFLFQPVGTESTLPFAYKISISTAHESAHAYTNFLHHHDLPMRLQVFRPHVKSLSF